MNELININYENTDRPTVMGRELHEALKIESNYTTWFKRMCEYGFVEGIDFWTKMSESTGGRPASDSDMSIDMAKQICMIQRSDIGRKVRQYFIDLEKAWNTPEQVMARALKLAEQTIADLKVTIEHKEDVIIGLVDDVSLADKRQILNRVVRFGKENYSERWNVLYREFENKYHINIKTRMARYNETHQPKCRNKLDYIDRVMNKIPELYEIAAKIYENDVKALVNEMYGVQ